MLRNGLKFTSSSVWENQLSRKHIVSFLSIDQFEIFWHYIITGFSTFAFRTAINPQ